MTNRYRRTTRAIWHSLLTAGVFATAATMTSAQTAATSTTDSTDTAVAGAQKLDTFVVTGSYIAAAADEANAMPVQRLDTSAIQQTGVSTSVLDVLRHTIPQIQGGNNIGLENANISGNFTNGGSMVSLRDTDTLVLVDGMRVASSPVAASGGYQFVDLNLIPVSAIERIEVLTDGASAIYGSDAVSGVINIILKKNFTGAEFDAHYGISQNDTGGYYRERAASFVTGASFKGTSLMVATEWSKADPLYERNFRYTNPSYGTVTYGGVLNDADGNFYQLKPGLNAPTNTTPESLATLVAQGIYVPVSVDSVVSGFNLAQRPTFHSGDDKRTADFALQHKISDALTAKVTFLYAKTDTGYILNPQPVTVSSTSIVGQPGVPITDTGITVRNRFFSGPDRVYDNLTNFYRVTAELDGKINDYFNWRAYVNYNDATQDAYGYNQILDSALHAGIQSGLINMFAIQQDPAMMAQANIFGTSVGTYTSKLYSYDFIANGKIFDLPSGPIQYAAGAEYRKDSMSAQADYNSVYNPATQTSAWNFGVTINPFNADENVKSYFAELKVPVFSPANKIPMAHLLVLDGAVRHESYSNGDSITVPKISLRYLPLNDQFAFRATYAKSFTAPSLYDLFGPTNSGSTANPAGLNAYSSSGQPTGAKFAPVQGFEQSGSNPNLGPAKATSWTVGTIISPKVAKGLEFTVDYYHIKQINVIGNPASDLVMMQSVEQYGPQSPYAQYIALNNYPGYTGATAITAPGQISTHLTNTYVLQTLVNIGSIEQDGTDIGLKYTLPWTNYGLFKLSSNWAYVGKFFVKTGPSDPGTEYAGHNDNGTIAKLRSYSSLDWTWGAYGATLGYTHIPSVIDNYGGGAKPYNTFDLQVRVDAGALSSKLNGLSLSIGCNNLTNQGPSLDPNNFSDPPADTSAYSPLGRLLYADLRYKF